MQEIEKKNWSLKMLKWLNLKKKKCFSNRIEKLHKMAFIFFFEKVEKTVF